MNEFGIGFFCFGQNLIFELDVDYRSSGRYEAKLNFGRIEEVDDAGSGVFPPLGKILLSRVFIIFVMFLSISPGRNSAKVSARVKMQCPCCYDDVDKCVAHWRRHCS